HHEHQEHDEHQTLTSSPTTIIEYTIIILSTSSSSSSTLFHPQKLPSSTFSKNTKLHQHQHLLGFITNINLLKFCHKHQVLHLLHSTEAIITLFNLCFSCLKKGKCKTNP
ncbi:hypothetical protein PIB30_070429, partial [Stylosanthes scabra]|nr:hypothetical protein [Stylosanthes scabra]